MVSWHTIFVCLLAFTLLGLAWVRGYDIVKSHSPESLPRFYIVMAIIRFLFVVTLTGSYILLVSGSAEESKSFALMVLLMYTAMMMITLIIKH